MKESDAWNHLTPGLQAELVNLERRIGRVAFGIYLRHLEENTNTFDLASWFGLKAYTVKMHRQLLAPLPRLLPELAKKKAASPVRLIYYDGEEVENNAA